MGFRSPYDSQATYKLTVSLGAVPSRAYDVLDLTRTGVRIGVGVLER